MNPYGLSAKEEMESLKELEREDIVISNTTGKHTPGPWKCWQNESEQETNYWRIRTSNDESLLDTVRGYCGEGNAKLITSSPDMYEALTMVAMAFDMAKKTMPVNMKVAIEQFVLPVIKKVDGGYNHG
jgi:hypothetical protein